MRRDSKLYKIDNQGNLRFLNRAEWDAGYGDADSGWERPEAAIIIMIVCGILDFVMFRQVFASFLYDSMAVQMLSIIGMLIGFDLAPIYGGIVLKKRQQGLNASMAVAALLGAAFLIALVGNIVLRIAVKDLVLPDMSSMTTSIFGEVSEADTSSHLALLYALFASVMPVITSLVSFGVSFQSANPLKNRIQRLKTEQVEIEDNIVKIEALLMEYEEDPEFFQRLLKEDEQRYQDMLEILREKTLYYCDYVRERLKEHLGNPTSNNELSKDNRGVLLQMLEGEDEKLNGCRNMNKIVVR